MGFDAIGKKSNPIINVSKKIGPDVGKIAALTGVMTSAGVGQSLIVDKLISKPKYGNQIIVIALVPEYQMPSHSKEPGSPQQPGDWSENSDSSDDKALQLQVVPPWMPFLVRNTNSTHYKGTLRANLSTPLNLRRGAYDYDDYPVQQPMNQDLFVLYIILSIVVGIIMIFSVVFAGV